MIRTWEDLNEAEQEKLRDAWAEICAALYVYQEVTGAWRLSDAVHDAIWEAVDVAGNLEIDEATV